MRRIAAMTLFSPSRVQAGVWIGLGVALLVLLYWLAPVLTPFALAAMLAYLLVPGVDWLTTRKLPRTAATLLMILLAALAMLGLLLILVPVLQREFVALQAKFPALVQKLNNDLVPLLNRWLGVELRLDAQSLRALLAEHAGEQRDLIASLLEQARAGGAALLGAIGTLLLVPVVLFYLLLDWHDLKDRLLTLVPRRALATTAGMLGEIDALLAQFLRGQLAVMGALALYYSVALAIAGFQSALPIGILAGALVFIPYVGFAIGLALALLVATLQFGSAYGFIAVAVVFGVGQVLESFVLTPRLVGDRIGLHPLAVIFALLAFGEVFGFFGVLLALPAAAALLVALQHVRRAYVASDFYLGKP
jgi:predicted PurR-regulated permease PerM